MPASLPLHREYILLGLYWLLGVALKTTHGHYHLFWIPLTAAFFGVFLISYRNHIPSAPFIERVRLLVIVLFGELTLLAHDSELIYITQQGAYIRLLIAVFGALLLAILAIGTMMSSSVSASFPLFCWAVCGGLLVAARVFVLYSSPQPYIDVFTINSEAAEHLLAGRNPYSQTYHDIYGGSLGYHPGFTYWPSYLLLSTICKTVLGDIRTVTILCDLVGAVALGWIVHHYHRNITAAWLLALLWLAFPVSLFVLEQAWTDPVIIAGTALLTVAAIRRKPTFCGIICGLLIGTKQYAFVPALCVVIYLWRTENLRFFLLMALSAAAVLAATSLPFLLWDFASFYNNTIALLGEIPPRFDSFSLVAVAARLFGWQDTGMMLFIFYAGVFAGGCAWLLWKKTPELGDAIRACVGIYGLLFFFGKQAFCNYYSMLAFLVLLLLAVAPHGEENATEPC